MTEEALREIASVIIQSRDPGLGEDFLVAMLTPRERKCMALRWRLVCMLAAGARQRDVARKLGVSLCKITRGSRELKYGRPGFKILVRKFVEEQRAKAVN